MPHHNHRWSYFVFITIAYMTIVVLIVGTIRGESSINMYFELIKSRDLILQTVNSLKKESLDLEQEIDKITSSPSYAKRVLKDQYHILEDDEKIFFFAD